MNYILIPKGTEILYLEEITSSEGDYELLFPPGINLQFIEDLNKTKNRNKKMWRLL